MEGFRVRMMVMARAVEMMENLDGIVGIDLVNEIVVMGEVRGLVIVLRRNDRCSTHHLARWTGLFHLGSHSLMVGGFEVALPQDDRHRTRHQIQSAE